MNDKVWWKSKTLWVGLVALVASIAQAKWGVVIDPATQGIILSIIVILFRLDTKGPVTATKPPHPEREAEIYAAQTVITAEKADTAAVNAAENVEELKK